MITFDKNDKALSMIADALNARSKDELDLALYLDKTMDEFCGARKGNELRAGSYAQLWELAGRVLRNPQLANGVYKSYKKCRQCTFAHIIKITLTRLRLKAFTGIWRNLRCGAWAH